VRPGAQLFALLREDGWLTPAALLAGLAVAGAGVAAEALLLRGMLELSGDLGLVAQRIGAIASIALFLALLVGLETANRFGLWRVGRHMETRLRMAFARKIPRLDDAYFRSRLSSDMAHRAHSVHELRLLAPNGGRLVQAVFTTILTTLGIIWLDPGAVLPASLGAFVTLGIPLVGQSWLRESDLRVRTHTGALSRFSLDAMLGLLAIRSCGAERSIRREQESLLAEWASAGKGLTRDVQVLNAGQSLASLGCASWIFFDHVARVGETGAVLLLLYWVLHLPVIAHEVTMLMRQYPKQRNITLRLLEPLGAPEPLQESSPAPRARSWRSPASAGVALRYANVSVLAGGHGILQGIDLDVAPGCHMAIVGLSGAGKSTLVGLLLGWYRPESGSLEVDGVHLEGASLDQLRRETAWVDPQVRLWNRTLLENLHYGTTRDAMDRTQEALRLADLRDVVGRLPLGLQTPLGDGGALLSGGEGQRLRFGRALVREGVRLAILDEPFRGLGRGQRHDLLREARRVWSEATLLCVTHEISETLAFPRVVVVHDGRIIEDGVPAELAVQEGSRFRDLLDAERAVDGMWAEPHWKDFSVVDGQLAPGST
jgi:ATP-binding cassette subfamily B protein